MFIRVQAVLAALVFALPAGLPAQTAEEREVLATIQAFLNAMKAKDTVGMKSNVDSLTRFTLLRPGASGTRVMVLTAADFVRAVAEPGGAVYDEPIRNPRIQIDGDLATVWAEYQVRMEGKVSHCGFDAFQLARLGGRWRILNVSDTFRRQGCGEAWAKSND
jgi:hypothetical protein